MRSDIPIGAETLGRIREALAGRGLELCHAGWVPGARKGKLTLTIDRDGGVTLADCETASHLAETAPLVDPLADLVSGKARPTVPEPVCEALIERL